jgi:hypothetical protein
MSFLKKENKKIEIRILLLSVFMIFAISAFLPQPAPLFAIALPEGRTLDEGHDAGYIDWIGSVTYANLFHRDALCPSGCNESMTQVSSGSSVSGVFSGDVAYFEVMLARSSSGGFGNATITACSSTTTVNLNGGGRSGRS